VFKKELMKPINIARLLVFVSFLASFLNACKKEDESHNYAPPDTTISKGDISGLIINAVTLKPISRGTVTLLDETGTNTILVEKSDPSGKFTFADLPEGVYQVVISQSGYQRMTAPNVSVGNLNPAGNFVCLAPVETTVVKPVGAVSGIILDQSFLPVANVTVSLASDPESTTNSYFATSVTDADGHYYIPAVPLTSITNTQILYFKVRVYKDGYEPLFESEIVLNKNEVTVMNFSIEKSGSTGQILFEEHFELPVSWIYQGFWHRYGYSGLLNSAFPQYVKLAPDDNSAGSLPHAFEGDYAGWFGEESTGNYMGDPAAGQINLSGGTSVASHSGRMISPAIQMNSTTGHATLSFWSWFEIESLGPGTIPHDLMKVLILDAADTTQQTLLATINPSIDPILEAREAIPLTSAGFNLAPQWRYQAYDLTPFVGKNIRLAFSFETVDVNSNGFRGWMIDAVRITGNAMKKR
jgi:hypothetical protein